MKHENVKISDEPVAKDLIYCRYCDKMCDSDEFTAINFDFPDEPIELLHIVCMNNKKGAVQ